MLNITQLCTKVDELEKIVAAHPDDLRIDYQGICEKTTLVSSEQLFQDFQKKTDANRLLKIGIIGRVKAGKSSLLNSLIFAGQDILPKAATPMTAALTILKYSKKLHVKVDFFTENDIASLRKMYNEYKKQLTVKQENEYAKLKRVEENKAKQKNVTRRTDIELRNLAAKRATEELNAVIELAGAKEQIESIDKSSLKGSELQKLMQEGQELYPTSLQELSKSLGEYVGANGRYTPFTRSVEISYPEPKLRDVIIVDTPGFNDPVPSREERARQLLKVSDVILILSPSGQFISAQDMDVMERISKKEGIQELYAIASQIDNQLYGDVKDKCNGDLNKVLAMLKEQLSGQMLKTINCNTHRLASDAFDTLLKGGQARVICTSSICQAMSTTWLDRNTVWDEEKNHVWANLKTKYSTEFGGEDESALSWLIKLGNAIEVDERLVDVKNRQKEILDRTEQEYLRAKNNVFTETVSEIMEALRQRKKLIDETNIDDLQQEQQQLAQKTEDLSEDLSAIYENKVREVDIELRQKFHETIRFFYEENSQVANDAKTEETRTRTRDKSGIGAWFARGLWGGGTEKYSEQVVLITTSQVKDAIENFVTYVIDELSHSLSSEYSNWKIKLLKDLQSSVFEHECLKTIGKGNLRNIVGSVLHDYLHEDVFAMDYQLPLVLQQNGKLEQSQAEEYLSAAKSELSRLQREFTSNANSYVKELVNNLKKVKFVDRLLEKLHNEQFRLEENIINKAMSKANIDRIIVEIEGLE